MLESPKEVTFHHLNSGMAVVSCLCLKAMQATAIAIDWGALFHLTKHFLCISSLSDASLMERVNSQKS